MREAGAKCNAKRGVDLCARNGQASADMTDAAITLENIALSREGTPVFAGLSLHLSERRVAVVGRNGAGKSSLIRLIAGLTPPQAGTVRVNGADLARDRKAALATVGILFQNPDHQIIFPSVIEELAFGLEQQGQSRAEARAGALAMLARFGHEAWAERLCHTLSQGQRQLVCLMAVLAMRPGWVLFDEPFASLDMPTALRIEARIAALEERVVLITHDPARAEGYERVIWLEEGRVAGDGPPAEVLPRYVAAMRAVAQELSC